MKKPGIFAIIGALAAFAGAGKTLTARAASPACAQYVVNDGPDSELLYKECEAQQAFIARQAPPKHAGGNRVQPLGRPFYIFGRVPGPEMATEPKATEPKAMESRATDLKVIEPKATESRATGPQVRVIVAKAETVTSLSEALHNAAFAAVIRDALSGNLVNMAQADLEKNCRLDNADAAKNQRPLHDCANVTFGTPGISTRQDSRRPTAAEILADLAPTKTPEAGNAR